MTFKPAVENFAEANQELLTIADMIEKKTFELNEAREKHLFAKASYENEFSRHLLTCKLEHTDYVQSEIVAQATNSAYKDKLEAIKAESSYRRLVEDIKSLRDKITVLQEVSWNLRKERTTA